VGSLTKRRIGLVALTAMVGLAFGPSARVARWREVPDPGLATVYAVSLADGQELVLKVAPPPGIDLLTHEIDLMRTEVEVYAQSAAAGVPLSTVVFADFDRTLLNRDYAFLSQPPGKPLSVAAAAMTGAELAAVRRQVARLAARLHTITGTRYGYPRRTSASWRTTWRGAFGAMVTDLVDDAIRLDTPLPAPPERVVALLRRHADALDDVRRPALVHFNLCDDNVLVTRCATAPDPGAPGRWRVSGLVGAERAFYGDPLAELVPLTLPRDLEDAPEVLEGFAAGTGTALELTGPVRRRLDLYRTYLYLSLAVERRSRGGDDPARLAEPLDRQLTALAAGPAGG